MIPTRSIRSLIKHTKKARHHQHKMAAAVIRSGKILAIGHNHEHQHAEHSALNRAWRSNVEGAVLVVVRIRKNGELAMAAPCDVCIRRMKAAGIKAVIYSDVKGDLVELKLNQVESDVKCPPLYPYLPQGNWYGHITMNRYAISKY